MATIENSYMRMVFSVRFLPRCYKQDKWSNELVVRQSLTGKNVNREAEDIDGIRDHVPTDEDTAN
jgi:hypothetical protein